MEKEKPLEDLTVKELKEMALALGSITGVSAMKGACPANISNNMTPNAYTSARASSASPRHCSGGMYAGVPIAIPLWVSAVVSPRILAMPKSVRMALLFLSSRTF